MKAHFIVNKSKKIGLGHWNRCQTLAFTLQELGVPAEFYTWSEKDAQHNNLFKTTYFNSSQELLNHFHTLSYPSDILVIDSDETSLTTSSTQLSFKRIFKKLSYFSVNTSIHFHCDYVISYNAESHKLKYSTDANTELLTGLEYFIFRDEFLSFPYDQKKSNQDKRLFVNFGGSDPLNLTAQTLEALVPIADDIDAVEVVFGSLSNSWNKNTFSFPNHFRFHYNINNISSLMSTCSLGICSVGSTFYELALLGIPCWVVASSSRELSVYNYLKSQKMAAGFGDLFEGFDFNYLIDSIKQHSDGNSPSHANFQELRNKLKPGGVLRIAERLIS